MKKMKNKMIMLALALALSVLPTQVTIAQEAGVQRLTGPCRRETAAPSAGHPPGA